MKAALRSKALNKLRRQKADVNWGQKTNNARRDIVDGDLLTQEKERSKTNRYHNEHNINSYIYISLHSCVVFTVNVLAGLEMMSLYLCIHIT